MSTYTQRLAHYGLTDDQYTRAVAAHELAHGLTAAARPTTTSHGVEIHTRGRDGTRGLARTGAAPGHTIDPFDRAVICEVGAIAKEYWLRNVERVWSSQLAYLVRETAAGDRANIRGLGLTSRQQDEALREAERTVRALWPTTAGVPKLVAKKQLTGSQVVKLQSGRRGFLGIFS